MEIFLIRSFQHYKLSSKKPVLPEELAALQTRYCSTLEKALQEKKSRGVPGQVAPKRGTVYLVSKKTLNSKGSSLKAFQGVMDKIIYISSERWAGVNHVHITTGQKPYVWTYHQKTGKLCPDTNINPFFEQNYCMDIVALCSRPEGYVFVEYNGSVWIKPNQKEAIKTQAMLPSGYAGSFYSSKNAVIKHFSHILYLDSSPHALCWAAIPIVDQNAPQETLTLIDLEAGSVSPFTQPGLNTMSDRFIFLQGSIYILSNNDSQIHKFVTPGVHPYMWKKEKSSLANLGFATKPKSFVACKHGMIMSKDTWNPSKVAYTLIDKESLKVLQHLTGKAVSNYEAQYNHKSLQLETKLGLTVLVFFTTRNHIDVILARPGKLSWVVHNKSCNVGVDPKPLTIASINRPLKQKYITRQQIVPKAIIYTFFCLQENPLKNFHFRLRLPA